MNNLQLPTPNVQCWPRRGREAARAIVLGICVLGIGSSVAACAKARAETAPDGPPLAMPEPPPRVLAPLEDPIPATATIPETPPTPPRAPSRPPARRASGTPAEAETRQEPPAPVAQTPVEPAPTETRELRPAPAANLAAADRKVRELLTRATRDLNQVDYGRLSVEGRAQYEQSKRFSQQAEQALKERNVVFATTLADKAATLAAELLRR